ncbi:aminoacyl-tRNA hydrolase [Corynebacterium sp. HMSC04H06]|uniref:aminoacyl-tRNA hydrolase n=1 Tax=Corynebacterium sp. HMSC04H06 TaxID=1581050 RepID=UPI0008A4A177|nr:aminoacyl-tRNA hydrolase [Corynebacterium sp. HMSC04H06]
MSFLDKLFSSFRKPSGSQPSSHRPTAPAPQDLRAEWLIVGLGNPGPKYAATRHNVGFMAVDDLLAATGGLVQPVRGLAADAASLDIQDTPVLTVRPQSFMNLSGQPVGELARCLNVSPERIIVIHDELDLPAHKVRLKQGGNENGHNGLKSLTEHLGTRDYLRVRIGIGRPPKGSSIPDYVLGPVDASRELDTAIDTAAEGARLIVEKGLAAAQNTIHSR